MILGRISNSGQKKIAPDPERSDGGELCPPIHDYFFAVTNPGKVRALPSQTVFGPVLACPETDLIFDRED